MTRLLWITANSNSYKLKFLSALQRTGKVAVSMLCGRLNTAGGHAQSTREADFELRSLPILKKSFGASWRVFRAALAWHRQQCFDWIQVPAEAKNLPLVAALWLVHRVKGFRLCSYNHAVVGSRWYHRCLSRLLYFMMNRVIFYTEAEKRKAIRLRLLPAGKAFFANNTLDHHDIDAAYRFAIKDSGPPTLLFIGRLIPNKRIDKLLEYFRLLKTSCPELRLSIIGDGPEAAKVAAAVEQDPDIEWAGATSDEEIIAGYMRRADLVINPGGSGLSVNHAFMYGKPYITCADSAHGPEIWYLQDGETGLMLSGTDLTEDCRRMMALLSDRGRYAEICRNAWGQRQIYSVEAWVQQMLNIFQDGTHVR